MALYYIFIYNKIKKVILIAIIDFEIKEIRQEEMETVWKITETKNSQKVLIFQCFYDIITS